MLDAITRFYWESAEERRVCKRELNGQMRLCFIIIIIVVIINKAMADTYKTSPF